jgi:hypothetical protein
MTLRQCGLVSSLAITLLASAAVDARADERVECAAAYEQTQRLQQKSELIAAFDAAARCARPSCPALLKDDCSRWTTEIRSKIPELVVRVRSVDGCAHTATKIESSSAIRKDGASESFLLNPGLHSIRVTDPTSGKTQSTEINVAQGERRDIDVDFGTPDAVCGGKPAKAVDAPPARQPQIALPIGAVGVGLVLVGASLGVVGALKRSDLESCKPHCDSARVDAVRPWLVAGDIIGGVGLLTIGAAVVTYFAFEQHGPATKAGLAFGPSGLSAVF